MTIAVLRFPGTNNEEDVMRALSSIARADPVLVPSRKGLAGLEKSDAIVIPGGFSYGDYVRAGAIWAQEIKVRLGRGLQRFVDDGKPILGICNGFQVLVEIGLLPAINGTSEYPEMALATNLSARYECRWVAQNEFLYLKHENQGNCVFTREIPNGKLLQIPIAHTEGRILFPENRVPSYGC